jgi:hypothetical protein
MAPSEDIVNGKTVLVLLLLAMPVAAGSLAPLYPGSISVDEALIATVGIPNVELTVHNNNVPDPGGTEINDRYIQYFAYTSGYVIGSSEAWAGSQFNGVVCNWSANSCDAYGFSNTEFPYTTLFPGETSGWVALWTARPEQGIPAGVTYSGFSVYNAEPASGWVAFNTDKAVIDWSPRGGPSAVPEPASLLLMAGGILGLAALRWHRAAA